MKARDSIVVSVVLILCASPIVGVMLSDDGDAADNVFTNYYKDQLTANQKIIYDSLEKLNTDNVSEFQPYGQAEKDWAVEVVVPADYVLSAKDKDTLRELVMNDMAQAWQATLLDDPYAWWCWYTDNAYIALYGKTFDLGDTTSVSGFSFYVLIGEQYGKDNGTMTEKMNQVKENLEKLIDGGTITGDTVLDKIRSINKYLTSNAFKYSKGVYQQSIYGALVHTEDGKHVITCLGYSQMFRLLCDQYKIPCTVIVGIAAQSENGGHAWNQVQAVIGGTAVTLQVDATFDQTGDSSEAYLLNGALSKVNGLTFTQTHQAFAPLGEPDFTEYHFKAPALQESGYSYPSNGNGWQKIFETYAPMILVGLICVVLSYVLITTARKGE